MNTLGLQYGEEGGAEVVEIEVRDPGPGEVQVETVACGICALDLYAVKHGSLSMPFTPPTGHEGVSYVTKIGPGVQGIEEGDRVAGGSFAQVSTVPADQLYRLPESDVPDEYWIVEPVSCVVTGVDRCELRPADRVAVVGCGFMGLMMVQLLAQSYAERVVGIDIDSARLELATRFGASAVYNATEDRLDKLYALDFDAVVEASGTQAGLDLAEQLVKTGGLINMFGWLHGRATFSGDAWHLGGYTVVNSSPFGRVRDTFPAAIRLLSQGVIDLRPLVTHVVSLEEYPSAAERICRGDEPGYIKGVVKLK